MVLRVGFLVGGMALRRYAEKSLRKSKAEKPATVVQERHSLTYRIVSSGGIFEKMSQSAHYPAFNNETQLAELKDTIEKVGSVHQSDDSMELNVEAEVDAIMQCGKRSGEIFHQTIQLRFNHAISTEQLLAEKRKALAIINSMETCTTKDQS